MWNSTIKFLGPCRLRVKDKSWAVEDIAREIKSKWHTFAYDLHDGISVKRFDGVTNKAQGIYTRKNLLYYHSKSSKCSICATDVHLIK